MSPMAGKWMGIGIFVLGFLLSLAGYASESAGLSTVLLLIGIPGAIGGMVVSIVFWMCPYCNSFLPGRAWFVEYCHRCGESIDTPRFK